MSSEAETEFLSLFNAGGQEIHQEYMNRRSTMKWISETEDTHVVSYEKMQLVVNLQHPRRYVNGKPELIPLSVPTGAFSRKVKDEIFDGIDELGMGVSIYFKLLKAVIFIYLVCSIVSLPLYYIYSCGEDSTSSSQSIMSYLTLGNLGQNQIQCNQANLRFTNSITLRCPSNTVMADLNEVAIEEPNASLSSNTCP